MDEWIASARCVECTQEFELARSSGQSTVFDDYTGSEAMFLH